jgi:hypothetical protein
MASSPKEYAPLDNSENDESYEQQELAPSAVDDTIFRTTAGNSAHGLRSRSSSFGSLNDDDDEEGVVRRYHLEFRPAPQPPEFSNLWQNLSDLRTQARQRRAARLLSTSDRFSDRFKACLITWCCDMTDRGILLMGILVIGWLLVGLIVRKATFWWLGIFVLTLRGAALWQWSRKQHQMMMRPELYTMTTQHSDTGVIS